VIFICPPPFTSSQSLFDSRFIIIIIIILFIIYLPRTPACAPAPCLKEEDPSSWHPSSLLPSHSCFPLGVSPCLLVLLDSLPFSFTYTPHTHTYTPSHTYGNTPFTPPPPIRCPNVHLAAKEGSARASVIKGRPYPCLL